MLVASCLDLGHGLPRRNAAGSLCLRELQIPSAESLGGNPRVRQTRALGAEARWVSAWHLIYPWSLTLLAKSLFCYNQGLRINAAWMSIDGQEFSEGSAFCRRVQPLPWDHFRRKTNWGWKKGKFKA